MTSTKGGRQAATGLAPRNCSTCGKEFQPYRDVQRACSRKCRELLGAVPEFERTHPVTFVCKRCGTESVRYHTIRGGRFYFCVACAPIAQREARERKQARRRVDPAASVKNRKHSIRSKYGLTVEQHDAMFAAQGGICAICGEPAKPDGVRAASRLHIDHNHQTGQVRGLLCNNCNRGLGYFRDRAYLLELAINYLNIHEP